MADDASGSVNRVIELRTKLREETTKREKTEAEKVLLEKQFKEKDKKLKQLKAEKADVDDKLRDLLKKSDKEDGGKRDFEIRIDKKKTKIKKFKREMEDLNKKLKDAEKIAKTADDAKRDIERKMKHRSKILTDELSILENETQQLKDTHERKLAEASVTEKAQVVVEESSSLKRYADERAKEDGDRISTLEGDKRDLERKLREIQRKVDELEAENNSLKTQLKIATERANEKIEKLKGKVGEVHDKLKQQQEKSDNLQNKVAEVEVQLKEEKMEEQVKEAEADVSSFERKSKTEIIPEVAPAGDIDELLAKEPGAERAKIWTYHPNSERWDDGKWSVKIGVISMEKRAFAEGSLRTAYMTKDLQSGEKYVTKLSKNRAHGREIYENDVEMQIFCMRWAERYNEEDPPKKVSFTNAFLVELIDRPRSPIATMELYMEGEYRKYSNNDGQTRFDRNTPQAFSHFTYERSNHEWVVIDIQGVDDVYTDPQVHTKDHKGFGIGNLGQKGIVKFVITHQCNAICKYMKLPSTQEKYGKINEIAMDKGTMPFPRELVKDLGTIDGIKIGAEAATSNVDFSSFKCVETIKADKVNALCMSYRWLFIGTGKDIMIYKLGNYELHATLKGHTELVETICVNDEFLFSGGADKDIRVWDLESLKCIKIITDHTSNIKALVVDSARIYSGSHDKTVRVWSLKDYNCEAVLHGHEKFVKAIAITSDSRALFSGGNDNVIKVWDLKTFECVYNLDSHTKWIKSLFVSGQYLFSGANDKRIKIWDLKTLDLHTTMKLHTDKINAVAATAGFFVSSSDDATVKTLQCVQTLSEHRGSVVSVCLSDSHLVSASFDGVKIWNWGKTN